ncbi:MAG: Do family serine endopeptidase [Pseudomonadota bacterium]
MQTTPILYRSLGLIGLLSALLTSFTVKAMSEDFTEVVEKSMPAVVNIETVRFGQRPGSSSDQEQEGLDEVPEMFRRFFEPFNDGSPRGRPDRRGGGSGFIFDAEGLIITNHHVIEDADEIIVRLSDRREFVAELVGSDADTDVAVLRIEAADLPVLEFGDSDALRPGQWVIAIGSPFNLARTVTAGIVSATGRDTPSQQYVPFIQTDAAINRGNSGGPLIDRAGQVVGINSWILSASGGNIGLSFSIPIEIAAATVEQLLKFGRVSRGFLGVGIQSVDRNQADALGLDRPIGALVNRIEPGSAAERGGIEVGDVILEVDGQSIEVHSDLPPLVGAVRPGEAVDLLISRWGDTQRLSVELDEREAVVAAANSDSNEDAAPSNALGLTIEPLTDDQRRRLENVDSGVVVSAIESDNAYRAGVRRGDLLQMINSQPVNSMDDFDDIVEAIEPGRSVALLIWRNGATQFVAYTPETTE